MLNLDELLNAMTVEGAVLVRIWDDNMSDYSFQKYLDNFQDADLWVYSRTVKYIYPIQDITNGKRHAAVVIELDEEG